MTDLAASNVTITIAADDMERIGRKRMNFVDVAFGNGVLTYPSGGVPISSVTTLGLLSECRATFIEQPHASGLFIKFNRTTNKFRIYQSAGATPAGTLSAEATHTHAENSAETYTKDATTGAGTSHTHTFTGSAIAAGAFVELGNVAVPALAFTMQVWGK